MTKNSPAKSTGCHVSIFGRITRDELLLHGLRKPTWQTGSAIWFLWLCVNRSKCLAESVVLDDSKLDPCIERLVTAADFAKEMAELRRDDAACELWREVYPQLSEGQPGLLGAVIFSSRSTSDAAGPYLRVTRLRCGNPRRITSRQLLAALGLLRGVGPVHLPVHDSATP